MYETYLITGVLLTLSGIITIIYLLCFLKVSKHEQSTIFSVLQSISTIVMGLFYVYSVIKMSFSEINLQVPFNTTIDTQYFNLTDVYLNISQDFFESSKYLDFIARNGKNLMKSNKNRVWNDVFLQYAMLTYSFVHGLVTLINTAMDCEGTDKTSEFQEESTSDQTNTKNKRCKASIKLIVAITLLWVLPTISIMLLYFIIPDSGTRLDNTGVQEYISEVIQNPLNISTATNKEQVNVILKNIYKIVDETKSGIKPISAKLALNTSDTGPTSYQAPTKLKIYIFVVFIVGLFVTIFYSQYAYNKLHKTEDNVKLKNLKLELIGFNVLWVPSLLETFARIYILNNSPGHTTEMLVSLSNSINVLTNIANMIVAKKLTNKQNNVIPIRDEKNME